MTGLGQGTVTLTVSPNLTRQCRQGSNRDLLEVFAYFAGSDGRTYQLHIQDIPSGKADFPASAYGADAIFSRYSDSGYTWSIGRSRSASASGAITLSDDKTHGTVDIDLLPDTFNTNLQLGKLHLRGPFSCPA